MTLSTVFGCVLATLFGSDRPQPGWTEQPPGALLFPERLHEEQLLRTRRIILGYEENIELFERLIRTEGLYTPEGKRQKQLIVDEWRAEVEKRKKLERQLLWNAVQRKLRPGPQTDLRAGLALERLLAELWPSPAIAPPPREVKQ